MFCPEGYVSAFDLSERFKDAGSKKWLLPFQWQEGVDYSEHEGLCCANAVWDSSHESSVVGWVHEQTYTPEVVRFV